MDPYFTNYEEMRDANRQGKVLQRLTNEQGSNLDPLHKDIENLQFQLRQKNMERVLAEIQNPTRILEIGAGLLDEDGRSFFTKKMTLEQLDKVHYCDANPALMEISPELQCLDIAQLSTYLPKQAFSHVIGSNVLDTLNEEDLERGIKEIKLLLQQDGLVIHCLNYEPYLYAFYDDILSKGSYAIPFVNSQNQHCAVVFHDKLIDHPLLTVHSEKIWQGILALDKQGYLQHLAETCLVRGGTLIKAYDYYLEKMAKAFKTAGFRVLKNELLSHEKALEIPSLNGKHITCGPSGVVTEEFKGNECLVTMQTHVFVAGL